MTATENILSSATWLRTWQLPDGNTIFSSHHVEGAIQNQSIESLIAHLNRGAHNALVKQLGVSIQKMLRDLVLSASAKITILKQGDDFFGRPTERDEIVLYVILKVPE